MLAVTAGGSIVGCLVARSFPTSEHVIALNGPVTSTGGRYPVQFAPTPQVLDERKAMTDEEMKRLAKRLGLPKVMWDTPEFRKHLIRLYNAGRNGEF